MPLDYSDMAVLKRRIYSGFTVGYSWGGDSLPLRNTLLL